MRARLPLGAAVFVLSLLVLAQVLLPGIAADRLRARLARSGSVEHVEVHAFPAVELLWHHADRVVVRMGSYRADPATLAASLAEGGRAGELDASTGVLATGLLTLREARLRQRGDELTGEARVTDADLRAAIPPPFDVRPIGAGGGQLLLQGTVSAFGASVSARFRLLAADGRLVVQPDVPLLGGLVGLTVFSDPHLRVEGVGARAAPGGFALTARGRRVG